LNCAPLSTLKIHRKSSLRRSAPDYAFAKFFIGKWYRGKLRPNTPVISSIRKLPAFLFYFETPEIFQKTCHFECHWIEITEDDQRTRGLNPSPGNHLPRASLPASFSRLWTSGWGGWTPRGSSAQGLGYLGLLWGGLVIRSAFFPNKGDYVVDIKSSTPFLGRAFFSRPNEATPPSAPEVRRSLPDLDPGRISVCCPIVCMLRFFKRYLPKELMFCENAWMGLFVVFFRKFHPPPKVTESTESLA